MKQGRTHGADGQAEQEGDGSPHRPLGSGDEEEGKKRTNCRKT